jgi:hypothetical protein
MDSLHPKHSKHPTHPSSDGWIVPSPSLVAASTDCAAGRRGMGEVGVGPEAPILRQAQDKL